MNEPTMETLAQRLDRVERENRRLKQAGVVALAVIAAVVLMGQATGSEVAKVIQAEKFVVRDAAGTVRATLGSDPIFTELMLADDKGHKRFQLSVGSFGQFLSFLDSNGQQRMKMSTLGVPGSPLGVVGISVFDPNNRLQILLGTSTAGKAQTGPILLFADQDEKMRARLGLSEHGVPFLQLSDKEGTTRAVLSLTKNANPVLELRNKADRVNVRLGEGDDGIASLLFYDKHGQVRAMLGRDADGRAIMGISDKAGKVIWSAP